MNTFESFITFGELRFNCLYYNTDAMQLSTICQQTFTTVFVETERSRNIRTYRKVLGLMENLSPKISMSNYRTHYSVG